MHVSAERRVCTIPANRRSRSLFIRSMDLDMCGSGARGGGGGGGVRVIYFKFSASRRIYLKHYVA